MCVCEQKQTTSISFFIVIANQAALRLELQVQSLYIFTYAKALRAINYVQISAIVTDQG